MRTDAVVIPKFSELMWPTLEALQRLGSSGTVQEIEAQVFEAASFADEQRSVLHRGGPVTELSYRMAWARTYLKYVGAVDNSQRGVWSITDHGRSLEQGDMAAIPARVRATHRATSTKDSAEKSGEGPEELPPDDGLADPEPDQWQERLLRVLLELEPAVFERLAQPLLREQGFVNVTVTGRSGDGGIDGTGILRMKLLSFPMFFQCKRYRGSVGPRLSVIFGALWLAGATRGSSSRQGTSPPRLLTRQPVMAHRPLT